MNYGFDSIIIVKLARKTFKIDKLATGVMSRKLLCFTSTTKTILPILIEMEQKKVAAKISFAGLRERSSHPDLFSVGKRFFGSVMEHRCRFFQKV